MQKNDAIRLAKEESKKANCAIAVIYDPNGMAEQSDGNDALAYAFAAPYLVPPMFPTATIIGKTVGDVYVESL